MTGNQLDEHGAVGFHGETGVGGRLHHAETIEGVLGSGYGVGQINAIPVTVREFDDTPNGQMLCLTRLKLVDPITCGQMPAIDEIIPPIMRIHDYVSLNKVLNKKIEGDGVGHSC